LGKAAECGAQPIEVGGTDDHIHLIVAIPPNLLISDLVGRIKGATSHSINQQMRPRPRFAWQKGYGVASFAKRNLPSLRQYVRDQKERHAAGAVRAALEAHQGATGSTAPPSENPRKRG
jgi:REP element-mobilizing transposase RayT